MVFYILLKQNFTPWLIYMVYLLPDPHLLASLVNANLPWWKALAELVDNSLDAGATRVVIDVSHRTLTVSDDGIWLWLVDNYEAE